VTLRVIGNTTRDIFYLTQNFPVPGESVLAAEHKEDVGGKGFNQAAAAVRAGAKVCFTTAVGNDSSAAILRTAIDAVEGMLADVLTAPFSTDESVIMISDDSENAIVSTAACARWLDARSLAPTLESVIQGDMLLMQGNMCHETTATVLRQARARGATSILNPAPLPQDAAALVALADIVVLNLVEACTILGHAGVNMDTNTISSAISSGKMLQAQSGTDILLTLGSKGCVILSDAEPIEIPAPRVVAVDTTGAGDTFTGWFCAGRMRGLSLEDAAREAVGAAALMVTRPGTGKALPSRAEYAKFVEEQCQSKLA
jgi:ribokinase